jgi:hypothetical protein
MNVSDSRSDFTIQRYKDPGLGASRGPHRTVRRFGERTWEPSHYFVISILQFVPMGT